MIKLEGKLNFHIENMLYAKINDGLIQHTT
jgi:hypothetical protein